MMKKKLSCLLLVIVIFLFSGCVFIPVENVVHSDPNKVTAIEVYYLEELAWWDETEKQWYNVEWNEKTSDWDLVFCIDQPIAYVNPEDYADFIADAKALPYKITIPLLPFPTDPIFEYYHYVVRIVSGDEEEILCHNGDGRDSHCDETVWINFLKKYIGEEVFEK